MKIQIRMGNYFQAIYFALFIDCCVLDRMSILQQLKSTCFYPQNRPDSWTHGLKNVVRDQGA